MARFFTYGLLGLFWNAIWWRFLSWCGGQSIGVFCRSVDWFLYDGGFYWESFGTDLSIVRISFIYLNCHWVFTMFFAHVVDIFGLLFWRSLLFLLLLLSLLLLPLLLLVSRIITFLLLLLLLTFGSWISHLNNTRTVSIAKCIYFTLFLSYFFQNFVL